MSFSARIRSIPPQDLLIICGLNLLPLCGVFLWGWQSFDLVFLYWMENVVIGAVMILRMVVRRYESLFELAFPLFLAPFFVVHYGMFCWGHGTFVISLFGDFSNGMDLMPAVLEVLAEPTMLMALASLVFLQLFDWQRDIARHGFGTDSVKDVMVAPYRRIVVLHITIIASGFLLGVLEEPLAGLVLLVVLKTLFDLWHFEHDRQIAAEEAFELSPEDLEKMSEMYAEPKVTVNGEERRFASFAELARSKELKMALGVMRLIGGKKEIKVIETYLAMKIAEEQGLQS